MCITKFKLKYQFDRSFHIILHHFSKTSHLLHHVIICLVLQHVKDASLGNT